MVRTLAEDESDRELLSNVEKYGWHLVLIMEDATGPGYAFSVGLFHSLNHPEICIFGLRDVMSMGSIINRVGDFIKDGNRFNDWQESEDILDGYPCLFRSVDPLHFHKYFGYALWFYEGDKFPMLQCVWPDQARRYPWDAEFPPDLTQRQPVLATDSDWPFPEAKN